VKTNEAKTMQMRIEAAKRYAAADRTDPWAFSRAMTHMANGIAGFTEKGEDAFYSADDYIETKVTLAGSEYPVVVYRNIVRP
jgi:hypothetical protein